MDTVALVISAAALVTSLFTFWWTNVRQKKSLFFVRTDRPLAFETLRFALVNGSKYPQLITKLDVYLEGGVDAGRLYPATELALPLKGNLIGAHEAAEYVFRFKEKFHPQRAKLGRQSKHQQDWFEFYVCLDISWVSMAGRHHTARVTHSVIALDAAGEIRMRGPFATEFSSYELHAIAA